MALVVLPDTLKVVQTYLLSVAEIAAVVGTKIRVNVTDTAWPSLRLSEVSTVDAVPRRLDRTLIQVDCWTAPPDSAVSGSGDAAAQLLARKVRAALWEARGYRTTAAVITGCADTSLRYQPDETREPAVPRWIVTAAVYVHPYP